MSDIENDEAAPVESEKTALKIVASDAELSPAHVADLASSCVSEAFAKSAGVYSTNSPKVVAAALKRPWKNGGALMFPFIDYDSRRPVIVRAKPDEPRTRLTGRGDAKVVKYEQAIGTGAVPYFGPGTVNEQRLGDNSRPLIWAEGEKKTLLLDSLGFPCLGLTGCHTWNDSKKNRDGDGMVWARELKKYSDRYFANRGHILCFDADAIFNPNVLLAMRRLAGILLESKATWVRFVRIPQDSEDPELGVGIDDFMLANGEEKTRALIDKSEPIAPGEDVEPLAPRDPLVQLASLAWLKPAKLPKKLRLPPKFEIRRDCSVWLEPPADKPDQPQRQILHAAIIPMGLLESTDGSEQRVEIAYYSAGKWSFAMVDRHELKGARKALDGLPPGTMIDSNNAALAVAWFTEFMHHNSHRMSTRRFISECGWQWDGDEPVFLLDKPITRGRHRSHIVADTSGDRSDALAALRPVGKLEGHKAALKRFFETDDVSAIIYLASLCAPLLEPLKAPNFAVHLYGESTTGKSTRQKCAAGIFGDPQNGTWVGSWNTTATAMETRANMLNHLPLFFDEIGAGDAKSIEKSMYMLVNGEGKSRSNRSLSNVKPFSFRNVTSSNGEHELTSSKANTGAQVRVIQIRSKSFEGMDRAAVDEMRAACDAHHGSLGRAWVQALVDLDDWSACRDMFKAAKALFDSDAANGLMQRQSVYFALMAVAEHMSHEWFGIGEAGGGTVRRFVANTAGRSDIASASDRAIESLSSWVYSEPFTFPRLAYVSGSSAKETKTSKGFKVNGARDGARILFVPSELQARFEHEGISVAEVLNGWREKGWIEYEGAKNTKKVRVDGGRPRFVVVKSEVLGIGVEDIEGAQREADFGD